MKMREVNKLRKLQDKVICKLEKHNYVDRDVIIGGFDKITLKDLKSYLYPTHETDFKEFLGGQL